MDEKTEKFLRAATIVLVPAFFIGSLAFHASESYRHSGEKFSVKISDKDFSKAEESSAEIFEKEKSFSFEKLIEDTITVPSFRIPETDNEKVLEESLEVEEVSEETSENEKVSEDEEVSEESSEDKEVLENEDFSEDEEFLEDKEISEEVLEDKSYEISAYDSIPYSAEDLFKFEATMTVECGAQGTSREVIIANCWIARNHIQKEIENGSENPFRSALNPNHFQPVFDDEYGWRVMHYDEPVTQELIDQNPDIHEICVRVLNGEIPSPIYDWGCCLPYDYFGFGDGYSFAEAAGIEHYIIIENGVFFPAEDWTEMCTWYCQNF